MFHGSIVALITPMDAQSKVDFGSLSKLVDFHLQHGTDALLVAGTTGESAALSEAEKKRLISHVVKQAAGKLPVIAGSGCASTEKTIAATEAAAQAGADACLIMTPPYVKPTQEGLFQHFKTISDSVCVPQILYNVPGRTACDILPETVARLADCPNIIGIKEASGSVSRVVDILNLCNGKLDVYSGDDDLAKDVIIAGGKGVISVTANVAPELCHSMCRHALAKEIQQAETIHQRLLPLHQALFWESNPIPVKWAMYRMGLVEKGIRLPLTQLSDRLQSQLEKIMQELGVID